MDKNACRDLIRWLIEKAQRHHNFVRIEMEDSTCTTDTIDLYRSLRSDFDNTGIVLQAYLRRTKTMSLQSGHPAECADREGSLRRAAQDCLQRLPDHQ